MEQKVKKAKYSFSWKGKSLYALAFGIPAVVFFVILVKKQVIPFGAYSVIRGDGLTQVYAFLCEMYRKVHSGDSLFFSWNMGLGTNFYATWTYYLASPLNWLLLLLPMKYLLAGCTIMIFVRLSLSALTMTCYLMHTDAIEKPEYKRQLALLGGVSYGMCNGVLCYCFLFQWLDAYWLLPLVLWGLEGLIKAGRWKGYYILLLFTLVSNFYLAYSVCLFLLLWFFMHSDWKRIRQRLLLFVKSSLLAAATAGIVLLPAACALTKKKNYINFDNDVWKIGNPWDMLNMLLPFSRLDAAGKEMETYNIYCGFLLTLSALFYLIFSRDSVKKRIKPALLTLFMGISLCTHFLSLLWHGGVFPRGFHNRYSFLFSFLLIYLGCKGICFLMNTSYVRLGLWALSCGLMFVGILRYAKWLGTALVYVSGMFIGIFFLILCVLLRRKSIPEKVFLWMTVFIGIFEISGSTYYNFKNMPLEPAAPGIYNKLEKIYSDQETEKERQAVSSLEYRNAGAMFNKKVLSVFSTMLPGQVVSLFEHLGMLYMESGSVYSFRGGTPYTNMLMNVSHAVTEDRDLYAGTVYDVWEGFSLMDLEGSLGYGFMTEDRVLDVSLESPNAFENQNILWKAMGGPTDIFRLLSPTVRSGIQSENSAEGREVSFYIDEAMDFYLFIKNKENVPFHLYIDENLYKEGDSRQYSQMLHLGTLKKGQIVTLRTEAEEEIDIYGAAFFRDVFTEYRKQVSEAAFTLDKLNGKGMSGTIRAKKDGLLYLSVPDDGGFTAYVDGKKTKHELLLECMVCIPLTEGEHQIKLIYYPPGFLWGITLSLLGIIIFLLINVTERIKYHIF